MKYKDGILSRRWRSQGNKALVKTKCLFLFRVCFLTAAQQRRCPRTTTPIQDIKGAERPKNEEIRVALTTSNRERGKKTGLYV